MNDLMQQTQHHKQIIDTEGNIYKGETKYSSSHGENVRHGRGTLVYSNTRDMYQGDFVMGLPHGAGRYFTQKTKKSYEGLWEHGILKQIKKGHASHVDAKGNDYNGEYEYWKRHGTGVYKQPDGLIYHGESCMMMLHLCFIFYHRPSLSIIPSFNISYLYHGAK